jgi:hypothetical protein
MSNSYILASDRYVWCYLRWKSKKIKSMNKKIVDFLHKTTSMNSVF